MTQLPPAFIRYAETVVPAAEQADFRASLDSVPPVSIRRNPYKPFTNDLADDRVAWCDTGLYLPERPRFTLDPRLHGGAYYVGEASSMFIETLFRQVVLPAFPGGMKILDLCAAPGGKSTHMAALAPAGSLLVSNEVIRTRAAILTENICKWGLAGCVVTNNDPAHFGALRHFFDVMLADAPCSGEGMFRKQPGARDEWSEANVELCARRQQRILADAWEALRPGGILIYSTCTFNRRENEENIEWMAENLDIEPVPVTVPAAWGIVETETRGFRAWRFFPHKTRGEGLFMTLMRKSGDTEYVPKTKKSAERSRLARLPKKDRDAAARWLAPTREMEYFTRGETVYACPADRYDDLCRLSASLNILYPGTEMGQSIRGELKPAHPLALYHETGNACAPDAALSLEEARDFLRKQPVDPGRFEQGLNRVCYEGVPLGWAKRIGGRVNNLYPKEYRILNL